MNQNIKSVAQIVLEEAQRDIIKLVTNYSLENVGDLVLLQQELNIMISSMVYDALPVVPKVYVPIDESVPEPVNPNIFPTPFDDLSMEVVPAVQVENSPNKPGPDNNRIFLIDINGIKHAITEYQYKHQNLRIPIGEGCMLDIVEWTTKNQEHLNAHPELRDKLVLDKLRYDEFLVLEGFTDMSDDENPFINVDGVLLSDIKEAGEQTKTIEEVFQKAIDLVDIKHPEEVIPVSTVSTAVETALDVVARYSVDIDKILNSIDDDPVTIEAEVVEDEPNKPTEPVFQLTEHQQMKFDGLVATIEDIIGKQRSLVRPPNAAYYMTVLEGAAGTGKTTMMKKVLEHLLNQGHTIIFCSPTHQALGVIRETLIEANLEFTESNDEFLMDQCRLIIKTLAAFLGIKMKRDLEEGTESFETDPRAAILTCDILAIDESSMISKDQLRIILQKLHINVRCILYIGDEVQLDSPSDNNESNGIFTLPQKFELEEVVRQAQDSKILPFAWELRGYIKAKHCPYLPSQLLHPGRSNEDIIIFRDQTMFIDHYMKSETQSKLISTYTNKITNEYNTYIRHLRLIGHGKPLDIDIDGQGKQICTDQNEYRELYVGEELVVLEPNQRNGEVIHQTGERIKITTISEKEKSVYITVEDYNNLLAEPQMQEFIIHYWEVRDQKGRRLDIVKEEDKELYNNVLALLSVEAKKATHKHKWAKYWSIKEKFVKVNKTFAFTLHKLQGSTCEDIYVDARDLDKHWKRMPIGVYKLLYIALTRPKNKFIVLI